MAGAELASTNTLVVERCGFLGGVGNGRGPALFRLSLEPVGSVSIPNAPDHPDCLDHWYLWSFVSGNLVFAFNGFRRGRCIAPVDNSFALDRGNHSADHNRCSDF